MRHEAARRAIWRRRKDDREIPCPPPVVVVNDLLATPDPPLPALTRIVTVPVFTSDRRLLVMPGYDAATGVYYSPCEVTVPSVPENPTKDEISLALALLLDEQLFDFAFAEPADKAHAVALMLLHFCRDLIDGPTPLHLIGAPIQGSGKGLLVRAALCPALGTEFGFLAMTRDEEEMRKRLTARFREGRPANVFDNVTRPVDSGVLANALTTSRWDDRILGVSESYSFPVRSIWAMTGNNPILSGEIARRTVQIRLDPHLEQPWLRDGFKHSDLEDWVKENRGQLIAAVLTLIQSWIMAGCPHPKVKPMGSYEAWARVIGGILEHVGIPGFLENRFERHETVDLETEAWRELVRRWWEKHKDGSVGTKELYPIAEAIEGIDLGQSFDERNRKTAFGMQLAKRRDQIISSYRIEKAGVEHQASQWRLRALTGEPY